MVTSGCSAGRTAATMRKESCVQCVGAKKKSSTVAKLSWAAQHDLQLALPPIPLPPRQL